MYDNSGNNNFYEYDLNVWDDLEDQKGNEFIFIYLKLLGFP